MILSSSVGAADLRCERADDVGGGEGAACGGWALKKMWAFACIFAAWRFPAPASRKPGKEEAEAQEGGRARDSGCQATLVTPSTSCVRASDH